MTWPNKEWEPGIITSEGKQLWYSRIATPEDMRRRQDYEDGYRERQELRLGALK